MPAQPTPEGLGPKATKLWTDISGSYGLRFDELRMLEDAVREVDIIERLEGEWRFAETMVKGSMGQEVASPLLTELRQHRSVLKALLQSLKLPDSDAGENAAQSRSNAARAMAHARWNKSG